MVTRIAETLAHELDKLSGHAGSHPPQTLEVPMGSGTLHIKLEGVDRIGCLVRQIEFRDSEYAPMGLDQLKLIGQRLAQRLSYLLEPVQILEADVEAVEVQLRSDPPHRTQQATSYYELVASRDGIKLQRFRKVPGEPRQVVATELTREVLTRLAADLSEAARAAAPPAGIRR